MECVPGKAYRSMRAFWLLSQRNIVAVAINLSGHPKTGH
jgi:hypothetical protein